MVSPWSLYLMFHWAHPILQSSLVLLRGSEDGHPAAPETAGWPLWPCSLCQSRLLSMALTELWHQWLRHAVSSSLQLSSTLTKLIKTIGTWKALMGIPLCQYIQSYPLSLNIVIFLYPVGLHRHVVSMGWVPVQNWRYTRWRMLKSAILIQAFWI